jgi:hypothetical protein
LASLFFASFFNLAVAANPVSSVFEACPGPAHKRHGLIDSAMAKAKGRKLKKMELRPEKLIEECPWVDILMGFIIGVEWFCMFVNHH